MPSRQAMLICLCILCFQPQVYPAQRTQTPCQKLYAKDGLLGPGAAMHDKIVTLPRRDLAEVRLEPTLTWLHLQKV